MVSMCVDGRMVGKYLEGFEPSSVASDVLEEGLGRLVDIWLRGGDIQETKE